MDSHYESLANDEVIRSLKHFYPIFEDVITTAMERTRHGFFNLGWPRPVERANDMHRGIRECLRPICDEASDWIDLIEEPEGVGMDYLVIGEPWTKQPLALRWGRIKDGRISRSGSNRSVESRAMGYLFDGFDEERSGRPMITLAYTVEGDYTHVGVPQWWIGEISVVRERLEASERVDVVKTFAQPKPLTQDEYAKTVLRSRELDAARWTRMLDKIRSDAA